MIRAEGELEKKKQYRITLYDLQAGNGVESGWDGKKKTLHPSRILGRVTYLHTRPHAPLD